METDQDLLKINCDNMSVIYLAKNQIYHARTKHIDISFYFVRKILVEGDVKLEKIRAKENPTNILAKVVSGTKFNHCKDLLHILTIA